MVAQYFHNEAIKTLNVIRSSYPSNQNRDDSIDIHNFIYDLEWVIKLEEWLWNIKKYHQEKPLASTSIHYQENFNKLQHQL